MTRRLFPLFFDTKDITLEQLTDYAKGLCEQHRDVNWQLADAVREAKAMLGPDNWSQAFPEWFSVGQLERVEPVSKAYKREDRNILATFTIHREHTNQPDRIQRVQAHVDKGHTSDEARAANQQERAAQKSEPTSETRWLLAVDVHYFLHRFWFSGAGVEAADGVASWVQRLSERLKEKGLTDVACCFDSKINHRKEFTKEWDDKYKDRPPKDPELGHQIQMVRELLEGRGFACVSIEGMEGDDCMASFAKQFDGRVTLLTQDKDCRQCLSDTCNMLLDVEWGEDETGNPVPEYKWLSAKAHTEATGIPPSQWIEYQSLMGDNTDGISGAVGIGEKGAADLIREFGTIEAAIAAAKDEDPRIKPAKRKSLIEFEDKLATTRQLVTLRTDLTLPENTKI